MSQTVSRIDRSSIEIAATPETIYAAFTTSEALMKWLPPESMSGEALTYDFRQGGRYCIVLTYAEAEPGIPGKSTERTDVSTGCFVLLEFGKRLVQSVEFNSSDASFSGEMIMTWTFEPTATGTKVTVSAENIPVGISEADHQAGLRSSLENLARYVS